MRKGQIVSGIVVEANSLAASIDVIGGGAVTVHQLTNMKQVVVGETVKVQLIGKLEKTKRWYGKVQ